VKSSTQCAIRFFEHLESVAERKDWQERLRPQQESVVQASVSHAMSSVAAQMIENIL